MKFETTAKLLTAALRNLTPVIERRSTIPILSTVLFDGRTITGTDLDLELSVAVPASVAAGKIAIDFPSLFNLVRHIPGDDTVRIEGGREGATVTFSSGRYDLPSLPASDYPELQTGALKPAPVDGGALKKAFAFVSPFISTEETRYYLNGVCLDGELAVSTDGHRLGCCPSGGDFTAFDRPIIPRKAIALLRHLPAPKSVEIATDRPGMRLCMDGVTMSTKLIDGTFPDWQRVVPKNADNPSVLTVNRIGLARTMARIAAAMKGGRPYVTLAFDRERLAISGRRDGNIVAREYVNDVGISGNGQVIGFQASYMRDVIGVFGDETINLTITDAGAPMVARGQAEGACALLMPARIFDEQLAVDTLTEWAAAQQVGRAA